MSLLYHTSSAENEESLVFRNQDIRSIQLLCHLRAHGVEFKVQSHLQKLSHETLKQLFIKLKGSERDIWTFSSGIPYYMVAELEEQLRPISLSTNADRFEAWEPSTTKNEKEIKSQINQYILKCLSKISFSALVYRARNNIAAPCYSSVMNEIPKGIDTLDEFLERLNALGQQIQCWLREHGNREEHNKFFAIRQVNYLLQNSETYR